MSIEWKFENALKNHTSHVDMDIKVLNPVSEMTLIEILERENDQNFGDARYDHSKPTTSQYEMLTLKGEELKRFIDALKLNEALKHVEAAKNPRPGLSPNPLLDPSLSDELHVLKITHNNGLGLLGQEFNNENTDDRNFEALVKASGLNEKQDDKGGGTHGVGKNVYWYFSKYGMVVFYSSLSKPYDDKGKYCGAGPGAKCAHNTRFMATCRVGVVHEVDGEEYAPQGLAGGVADGNAVSLFDDKADEMAIKLGMDKRDASDPGVTILIVGFRNPNEEEIIDDVVEDLVSSAENHWFPAKISGALEVSGNYEDGNERNWEADKHPTAQLLAWLEKGLDTEPGPVVNWSDPEKSGAWKKGNSTYKRIEVELKIPKDYPGNPTNNIQHCKAVLALQISDLEWPNYLPAPELGLNQKGNTACIRHNGMVVTYKPFIQRPVKQYRALLLTGESVELFDKKLRGNLNEDYQSIGEEMLKYSEPTVHDDIIPKQFEQTALGKDELKKIAKTGSDKIRDFLKDVTKAIRKELGEIEPPTASEDASWYELSKELDFGKANTSKGGRVISITKTSFSRIEPNKGKLNFTIEVPPGTDEKWSKNATGWSIELKATVKHANGKTEAKDIDCWDFGDLLIDSKALSLSSNVSMNYGATLQKWKKPSSPSAKKHNVDEWEGEQNILKGKIMPNKPIKLSFKGLEIDLTGLETTSVDLAIIAKEVNA